MKKLKNSSKKITHYKSEYVTFSFKYITKNKEYNLEFFKDKTKRLECYIALIEKIKEIENIDWKEFIKLPKKNGMETIPINQLNITTSENLGLNKFISIRFNKNNYRIIGYKEESVFKILGFDFNYSAYKH